jgi:hypothetical protein
MMAPTAVPRSPGLLQLLGEGYTAGHALPEVLVADPALLGVGMRQFQSVGRRPVVYRLYSTWGLGFLVLQASGDIGASGFGCVHTSRPYES